MTTGKLFERPRRLPVVLGGDTRLSARGDSNLRKNIEPAVALSNFGEAGN
jgi:hypothetical protein